MNQFIVVLILTPPAMASASWILGRAWSLAVGGGRVSERVRRWQRLGFWGSLAGMYAIGVVMGIAHHKF